MNRSFYGKNILDTKDRSFCPIPNKKAAQKMRKKIKYQWATQNKPGEFMMINKKRLNIDGKYQRKEVSRNRILEIARNWDWRLIKTISIARRIDGTYWVFDGGHRVRASFYRDEVIMLPCMVFDETNIEGEAKAFIGAQKLKVGVSAQDCFRAAVVAKEPIALKTQELLKEYGYIAVKSNTQTYIIGSIGYLQKMIKDNEELTYKIFDLCVEMDRDFRSISHELLKGLFYLAQHFQEKLNFLEGDIRKKIIREGISGIERYMKDEKYNAGKGGGAVLAKGILNLINKGKRNRKWKW